MITKRCQGRHLGFPRGSHQGVLREPVRAESGGTPRQELLLGASGSRGLRVSGSPNAARGITWGTQGGATRGFIVTKRCRGQHFGHPRRSRPELHSHQRLTHTEGHSYSDSCTTPLTNTQTHSHPDSLIHKLSHTQTHLLRVRHNQTYPYSDSPTLRLT